MATEIRINSSIVDISMVNNSYGDIGRPMQRGAREELSLQIFRPIRIVRDYDNCLK